MADTGKAIPFTLSINNQNSKQLGDLYRSEIENMTMPEFEMIADRLMKVQRNVRYDTIVYQPVNVTAAHRAQAFKHGIDDGDQYATDKSPNGKYTKTEGHTNMNTNGAFQIYDFAIIRAIEVPLVFPVGKPTTVVDGLITNPTAVLSATNYDPYLLGDTFGKAFKLLYSEAGEVKEKGRLQDFTMISGGQSGVMGASAGGVAQNAMFPNNALNRPRVIEGLENFHIDVVPLYSGFDLTSYGVQYGLQIKLHTIELLNQTA